MTMPLRNQPIYNRQKEQNTVKREEQPMTNPPTTDLGEIIRKIISLQRLSAKTGFFTKKSVCMLLGTLSPDDLVRVSDALAAAMLEEEKQS